MERCLFNNACIKDWNYTHTLTFFFHSTLILRVFKGNFTALAFFCETAFEMVEITSKAQRKHRKRKKHDHFEKAHVITFCIDRCMSEGRWADSLTVTVITCGGAYFVTHSVTQLWRYAHSNVFCHRMVFCTLGRFLNKRSRGNSDKLQPPTSFRWLSELKGSSVYSSTCHTSEDIKSTRR